MLDPKPATQGPALAAPRRARAHSLALAAYRRHPVLTFVVRRAALGGVTLLVVSFLIFLATNALPGNVAQIVLGKNATPAHLARLERELGLDRPFLVRYGNWLGGAVRGDLGQSAVGLAEGARSAPVGSLIAVRLRNSLVIGLMAALLLLPLALVAGTVAAVRAGRFVDYAVSYASLVLGSLPEFVLGTFLIFIFFSQLDLLPPVALVAPGGSPLARPDALVLPVLTLLGVSVAFCARQVRAGVIGSLRQDYVRMARLHGLRERRVLWRYALRNALAPSVQAYAQTVQYLFGGIIVVEALFAYPGIGGLLVNAVQTEDVTLVAAIALVLAAAYIAINIVADLIVLLLVPRLRTGLS
jgi:peptide/nickel transport system permease protein